MMSNITGWHALILLPMIVLAVLWVCAFVSIARSRVNGTEQAVWVLIVLIAPFLGALAWFAIGPRKLRT